MTPFGDASLAVFPQMEEHHLGEGKWNV